MTKDAAQYVVTDPVFDRVMEHLLAVEGGYVDDPVDRGGETKFGISKRRYPHLSIANLTLDQAIELYRRDYWEAYGCARLPPAFAAFYFDCLVQHNPKTAGRLLQMALRVTVDGYVGPATVGAANTVTTYSSYPDTIATAFAHRADLYHDLIVGNSSQARFALGWFKRLFMLQHFIFAQGWHGRAH